MGSVTRAVAWSPSQPGCPELPLLAQLVAGYMCHCSEMASEVVLVRHGETEWSMSGQHTGITDIPLTENGRDQARSLKKSLTEWKFSLVLVSPLGRAQETARLAGIDAGAITDSNLREWDYGEYEGLTTKEIRKTRPGWTVFGEGVVGGETVDEVGARTDLIIAQADVVDGSVAKDYWFYISTSRAIDLTYSRSWHSWGLRALPLSICRPIAGARTSNSSIRSSNLGSGDRVPRSWSTPFVYRHPSRPHIFQLRRSSANSGGTLGSPRPEN